MNPSHNKAEQAKLHLTATAKIIELLVASHAIDIQKENVFSLITSDNPLEALTNTLAKFTSMENLYATNGFHHVTNFLIKLDDNPILFRELVEVARIAHNLPKTKPEDPIHVPV